MSKTISTMGPGDFKLSPTQAAELLGVSVATVNRWHKRGYLRCWRSPAGWRRFSEADVRRIMRALDEVK